MEPKRQLAAARLLSKQGHVAFNKHAGASGESGGKRALPSSTGSRQQPQNGRGGRPKTSKSSTSFRIEKAKPHIELHVGPYLVSINVREFAARHVVGRLRVALRD